MALLGFLFAVALVVWVSVADPHWTDSTATVVVVVVMGLAFVLCGRALSR